ncbi:MAG: bifunctional hydroxymethylpyrimidine kinase/phosphomethylpyrimidine kinase, partial [Duncaniella sp.]|nr:bifunctional hydroxymethylpyrimidine kinase/phosphomethylpyrimidine kinase [Duncaniella sp.]
VVDPVMVSTSGARLLDDEAVDLIVRRIFPLSALVTPNIYEARTLTGESAPDLQARMLFDIGCRNVLLKGGDSEDNNVKTDILYLDRGTQRIELRADAVDTANTHGTGCTLSSAIASYLALGHGMADAINAAKLYITEALRAGATITTGHGHGPVNHFYAPHPLKNFNPDR